MIFRADLLDPENVASIQETCQDNWPFPHIVVQDAIQENFLRQVRNEINANLLLKRIMFIVFNDQQILQTSQILMNSHQTSYQILYDYGTPCTA